MTSIEELVLIGQTSRGALCQSRLSKKCTSLSVMPIKLFKPHLKKPGFLLSLFNSCMSSRRKVSGEKPCGSLVATGYTTVCEALPFDFVVTAFTEWPFRSEEFPVVVKIWPILINSLESGGPNATIIGGSLSKYGLHLRQHCLVGEGEYVWYFSLLQLFK